MNVLDAPRASLAKAMATELPAIVKEVGAVPAVLASDTAA